MIGILVVVSLYGMIAYAGMRTARRAATRYTKLLASGLTSLILCQGILNIFVVLGIAPLTGVPLAIHLLCAHQPAGDARLDWDPAEHRASRRPRAAASRRARAAAYIGGCT